MSLLLLLSLFFSDAFSFNQNDSMKIFLPVEGLADEEILASHLVSSWYECVSFCLEEGKNCTWFLYSELVGRRDNCYLHGKDSEDSERDFDLLTYAGSKEENWQVYKLVKIALVCFYIVFTFLSISEPGLVAGYCHVLFTVVVYRAQW